MEVKNKKEFLKLRKQTTLDSDKIPKNTPYCYTVDRDRIKNDKTLKDGELPIIMCPYYVWGKKDKGYHGMKSNLCREKGIRLLHVREDLWRKNKEKMKKIIEKFIYGR